VSLKTPSSEPKLLVDLTQITPDISVKPVVNSLANARTSGELKIPRYGGGQKAGDGGKGGKAAERPIPMLHPSSPTGVGHPGLPTGLFRSSMIPISKSPTKATPRLEARTPERAKIRKIYDDPPVLSPQVPMKVREPGRISLSMAKSAADAFQATPPSSPLKSAKVDAEKSAKTISLISGLGGIVTSNEGRSRLQLKPATSPQLVLEKYPVVESIKLTAKKLQRPSSGISTLSQDKGKRLWSGEKRKSGGKRGSNAPEAPLVPWTERSKEPPVNSGGWSWVGKPTAAKVYVQKDELPVTRLTYAMMRHEEGDEEVGVKDCILLASGNRKKDLPFIAKVTALWENPEDGEMRMSVLWYYRPEHTDVGRQEEDLTQEIFASKHRDNLSVACIEDKCFVMTFNEFCRYRKFCKLIEDGVPPAWNIVPELEGGGYPRAKLLPTRQVPVDRVFLARKVYDSRCKRIMKNPI